MKRALQVASVASMIDQFTMLNINVLQEMGFKVDVAANFDFGSTSSVERVEKFKNELNVKKIDFTNILFDRNVFSRKNIEAYKKLKNLIEQNDYDIIHCHSPIGGVLTRFAARKARKKGTKVIYTAHGFHFFKGASIKNWVLYFPVEFICSYFTDTLITINKEDFQLAKKFLKPKDISLVAGVGVDVDYLQNLKVDKQLYLDEFSIPANAKILLSVGELTVRKNHKLVIETLAQINDNNLYYIICGKGDKFSELNQYVLEKGLENNVIFTGFRTDVKNFYHVADIFLFPSKQEGLPVALMEAVATGLVCVASNIRGNIDLLSDDLNSQLFSLNQRDDLSRCLSSIKDYDKRHTDREILEKIDVKYIEKKLIEIYSDREAS